VGNKKTIKVVTVLTIITGILTLISAGFNFLLPMYLSYKFKVDTNKASSIGIIGGADGPTAIYLTSGLNPYLTMIIFMLLTIVGIIYLIIHKKGSC